MSQLNKFGIPTEKWNRLGDTNQETFNQVYGKIIDQKGDFLNEVPSDLRNQFTPYLERVMIAVCTTAVMELHTA